MRDKEQATRSALGGAVRELEQASKEFVELLGKLDPEDPIVVAFRSNAEISAAFDRCRDKLSKKSDASRRWQESLGKGPW